MIFCQISAVWTDKRIDGSKEIRIEIFSGFLLPDGSGEPCKNHKQFPTKITLSRVSDRGSHYDYCKDPKFLDR